MSNKASAKKASAKKASAKKVSGKKKNKTPAKSASREAVKLIIAAEKAQGKALAAITKILEANTKAMPTAGAGVISAQGNVSAAASSNNPSRSQVAPKVVHQIARKALLNYASEAKVADLVNGNEALKLGDDLNLDANERERLSTPYSRISEDEFGGEEVGPVAARNADIVSAAIDLVHRKANKKV